MNCYRFQCILNGSVLLKMNGVTSVLMKGAKKISEENAIFSGFHLGPVVSGQRRVKRPRHPLPTHQTCCFTPGRPPDHFVAQFAHPWGEFNLSYPLCRKATRLILLVFKKCFEISGLKTKHISCGAGFTRRTGTTFIVMVPALQHH